MRAELHPLALHCRVCQYSHQCTGHFAGHLRRICVYEGRIEKEICLVVFGSVIDWDWELWVSCELEMGVAVDGRVAYGEYSLLYSCE